MTLNIDNETYNLEIVKKSTTKNIYIRVKDDLTIYVTCNTLTSNKKIMSVVEENLDSIRKMIKKVKEKIKFNSEFYFLGKKYDIIYTEFCDFKLGENKVFISKDFDYYEYPDGYRIWDFYVLNDYIYYIKYII